MTTKVQATFDGNVFCPIKPLALDQDHVYLLVITPVEETEDEENVEDDPAFDLASLAVDTGISDFAAEHDHYLYGTPKQEEL